MATVVTLRARRRHGTRRRRAVTRDVTKATAVVARTTATRRRTTGLRAHTSDVARLATSVTLTTRRRSTRGCVRAVTRHMSSLVAAEARLGHSLVRAVRGDVTLLTAVVADVRRPSVPTKSGCLPRDTKQSYVQLLGKPCAIWVSHVRRPQLNHEKTKKQNKQLQSPISIPFTYARNTITGYNTHL